MKISYLPLLVILASSLSLALAGSLKDANQSITVFSITVPDATPWGIVGLLIGLIIYLLLDVRSDVSFEIEARTDLLMLTPLALMFVQGSTVVYCGLVGSLLLSKVGPDLAKDSNVFFYFLSTLAQVVVAFLAIVLTFLIFSLGNLIPQIRHHLVVHVFRSKIFLTFISCSLIAIALSCTALLHLKTESGTLLWGANYYAIASVDGFFALIGTVLGVSILFCTQRLLNPLRQVRYLAAQIDSEYWAQIDEILKNDTAANPSQMSTYLAKVSMGHEVLRISDNDPFCAIEALIENLIKSGDSRTAADYFAALLKRLETLSGKNVSRLGLASRLSRLLKQIYVDGDIISISRAFMALERLIQWSIEELPLFQLDTGNPDPWNLRSNRGFFKKCISKFYPCRPAVGRRPPLAQNSGSHRGLER